MSELAEQAPTVSELPAARLDVALGVEIDPLLLERALTHRSFAYEHGGLPHNERLEFLGDSVLGLVITESLFRTFPDLPEGRLAKLRASVVNMRALADVARAIPDGGIGPHLRLGRGEETTGGRDKASILADTLEALLGAIYLQHGLPAAAAAIHRLFDPMLASVSQRGAALDWKTSLQELTAALSLGAPDYLITSEGPDHDKSFTASARVAGETFGAGEGRSKKEAEQRAAQLAWTALKERTPNGSADGAISGVIDAAEPASPAAS